MSVRIFSFRSVPRMRGSSRVVLSTPLQCVVAAALAFTTVMAGAATLPDQPDSTYVTDGSVESVLVAGDTVYIGGSFQRVGPRTGPGVSVGLDGSLTPNLAQLSGAGPNLIGGESAGVNAVIADGQGGWYVGGLFTHAGSLPRSNVAHILAAGGVDPAFNVSIDGGVSALAIRGTTLFVGGSFSTIDGQSRVTLAAVSGMDGSLLAFNPAPDAGFSGVSSLAVSPDGATVYVGGDFATMGGQPHAGIAAINAVDGTVASIFNPVLARSSGDPGSVSALALAGTTLYVAGNFDTIGGVAYRTVAALDTSDGSVISTFAPTPSYFGCAPCATVNALAVSGSALYVGGSFDTMGGAARNNLAAIDMTAGVATAFDPEPNANIISLAASASAIYVGGGFTQIGGQPRIYAAALSPSSGNASAFDPSPNGTIGAIAVSTSSVYLGGLFSSIGGIQRNSLAAIRVADGTPTDWNPSPEGSNGGLALVQAMSLAGGTLYVGGYFTTMGGAVRSNLAAVDTSDGTATPWDPSSNGVVNVIAAAGDIVYVGGSFTGMGTETRIFIAAVSAADGSVTTFDPSPDDVVFSIVPAGDLVYVGGGFAHIGGAERVGLAALNASDGTPTTLNAHLSPDPTGYTAVYAMVLADPLIYIGGGFGSVRGTTRNNIASVSLDDGTATAFDPESSGPENGNAYVVALAVDGDTVYAGGYFSSIGGQPRGMLAALNASDGTATSFNPNASGGTAIYTLGLGTDGSLYVGGSYPTFDLAYQQGFAAFTPTVPNDRIFSNGFDGT